MNTTMAIIRAAGAVWSAMAHDWRPEAHGVGRRIRRAVVALIVAEMTGASAQSWREAYLETALVKNSTDPKWRGILM